MSRQYRIIFPAVLIAILASFAEPVGGGQASGQKEEAKELDRMIKQVFQGQPVPSSEKPTLERIYAALAAAKSRLYDDALASLDKVVADYDQQAGVSSFDPKDRLAKLQRLQSHKRGVVILALRYRSEVLLNLAHPDQAFADADLAVKLAPGDIPELFIDRALCQSRRKNYEQAKADLTTVINSNVSAVKTLVALKLRGDISLQQYHFDEAIDDYTLALRMDPEQKALVQALEDARAQKLKALEDLSRTLEDFNSKKEAELKKAEEELAAAKTVKAKITALAKRAAIRKDLMEYELSEEDYTTLIVLDPGNPQWYKNRGDLREITPDNQQAAVDDYTVFLKKAAGTVDVYSGRGRAYDRLGKYDLAILDFDEALKLKPGDDPLLYWRGLAKMKLGNSQAAIRDYTAALAINPNKAVYFESRAEVYEKVKDYGRAIEDATSAIDLEPNEPRLYLLRGDLFRKAGEYDKALADCDEALELDPESTNALGVRADTYLYKGDYKNAVTDYTTFIAIKPNVALAYYRRGRAYQQLQRYAEAVADFKKTVELNTKSVEGLNSLAWILATCPKPEIRNGTAAVAYARKALELAGGKDYSLTDTLATALAEAGQFEEAVALQEKAVSLIPADADKTERSDMEKRLALFKGGKPYREK